MQPKVIKLTRFWGDKSHWSPERELFRPVGCPNDAFRPFYPVIPETASELILTISVAPMPPFPCPHGSVQVKRVNRTSMNWFELETKVDGKKYKKKCTFGIDKCNLFEGNGPWWYLIQVVN